MKTRIDHPKEWKKKGEEKKKRGGLSMIKTRMLSDRGPWEVDRDSLTRNLISTT